MKKMNRRKFLRYSVHVGGAMLASQLIRSPNIFASVNKKFTLNVGYLPISDHLILPVAHALDNSKYKNISVRPYLCKSWDEILGKVDMGLLNAAFMLAPLAMYKLNMGSPLRCVMLGHTNGSVIAAKESIVKSEDLVEATVGIPHDKSTHRVLLYKYLKDERVKNMNEIKLVKIPPPLTVKNMKEGKIKAYCVAEPWGWKGVNEGVAHIVEYSKNIIPDHVCCLVMVSKRVIEKQPDALSEWVMSLQRAGKFIHTNPDQAGLLQEPYMKNNPNEMAQIIKNDMISYMDLRPNKEKLGQMHDLAFECGILSNKCNLNQFIDNRFV